MKKEIPTETLEAIKSVRTSFKGAEDSSKHNPVRAKQDMLKSFASIDPDDEQLQRLVQTIARRKPR
jgi:hypothetical protein